MPSAFAPRAAFAVLATVAIACKHSEQSTPPPAVAATYYVGTTTTTSPDGAQPYGPAKTIAVRRTVDSAHDSIEELVVHPGEQFITTLQRRPGDAAVFAAGDRAGSFTGTVTFTGPEWAWTAWTYDIAMTDGSGELQGTGRLTAGSLDTDKLFISPDGQPRARIHEHLEQVDETIYKSTRDQLLPPAQ
ncbi:hypothetical protein [Nannocystis punicea]|uniref:Lipoprotein n=1 Tax=Nannocystis punicea TaxID=2995304 RepID=A0ABY7H6T6_9BACT|nr:hypothetical protein [Nannocystis poenicansa]WAS94805.1 hypothetical protein O0S08_01480 [Nannocystis poenicansa]